MYEAFSTGNFQQAAKRRRFAPHSGAVALIETTRAEEEISPEFVHDIQRVIQWQAGSELSNFAGVWDVTARLQVEDSPPEIPFCQKRHDIHRSIGHLTVHFLPTSFKKGVAPIDLKNGDNKFLASASVFCKLASELRDARTHRIGDCHPFG